MLNKKYSTKRNNEKNKQRESVIPDHSISTVQFETGNGRAQISRNELAALMMVFSNFSNNEFVPIKIFGKQLYVRIKQDITTPQCAEFGYTPVEDLSQLSDSWLQFTDTLFEPHNKKNHNSKFEATTKICISVFNENKEFNSEFTFFINKKSSNSAVYFFVNASCSPTQLLSGNNTLPIKSFSDTKIKAKYLIRMYTLPFFILGRLIDKYALVDKNNLSELTTNVLNNNIVLNKIQIAAYSKMFRSEQHRNLAQEALYQIFTASLINKNSSKSADVASSLGFEIENTKSSIKLNKFGVPISRSGLMLKFSYGTNRPTYSMGIYCKDIVNTVKNEEFNSSMEERGYTKVHKTVDDNLQHAVNRSIRFDLSIHKLGLEKMSVYFNKLYGTCRIPQNSKASDILLFLEDLLNVDSSLGIIFKYMFTEQMKLDQLLSVTYKQWNQAFDILKDKGYHELVENLKKRQNMLSNNSSFTSLVKKYTNGKEDPSRLANQIKKKTTLYHPSKENVILNNGVDIRFPYYVAQLARERFFNIYEDPDAKEIIKETGVYPNDYNFEQIKKVVKLESQKLFRHLINGEIRSMPILPKSV